MGRYSSNDYLDAQLRLNRLDGSGLYYGRKGRMGPVAGEDLALFLDQWHQRDVYRRMGVIPLMEVGLFDDKATHETEALLGDRMIDFEVDEDDVVLGLSSAMIDRFIEEKAGAMKAKDEEDFRNLADARGFAFHGLLDGPWTALLHRTFDFCLGAVPRSVVLLAGLGLRSRERRNLPLPEGFEFWKQSPGWFVAGRRIASIDAPERSRAVELVTIRRMMAECQASIHEIAKTSPWAKMMAKRRWTEVDLEVELSIHLES